MKIPFLNIAATYKELKKEIDEALGNVLQKGVYILGEEVENFEKEFASYCNAKYCCAVSNGLDALSVGLKAGGINKDDEVIVPAHTFIATWLAVENIGAKVIPVDVEEESYNLNPSLMASAITKKTKAIIPVHLYGHPANMNLIMKVADQFNLLVIEDAAQAHGAKYNGKVIGSLGNTTCFSFYPGKNLGAFGDAGAIVTDDLEIYKKAKMLSNYGSSQKYIHDLKGGNCRLDEIQATILRIKLRYLNIWNERRKMVALQYLRGITNPYVQLPQVADFADHAWHLFVIRSKRRDDLKIYLKENGIETLIHYPVPPFKQKAYINNNFESNGYLNTVAIANEVLSLPIGPHLQEDETQEIINKINQFK